MKTVPLATFNELEPARLLRARLENTGVPAVINDESKTERYWFISKPVAAIHVEAEQPHYRHARELIAQWDRAEGVLRQAVHCPDCRSTRVEFPQMPRKFLSPRLMSLFFALRLVPREFYCLDCHFTWPFETPVEPARDVLGWSLESKHWHPKHPAGARQT